MEEQVINPWLIYLCIIICFGGLGYIWLMYQKYKRIILQFIEYKLELVLVKNKLQYFKVYEKIVRWSVTVGTYPQQIRMRDELFTLLKERKDELNIKKNPKVTYV